MGILTPICLTSPSVTVYRRGAASLLIMTRGYPRIMITLPNVTYRRCVHDVSVTSTNCTTREQQIVRVLLGRPNAVSLGQLHGYTNTTKIQSMGYRHVPRWLEYAAVSGPVRTQSRAHVYDLCV